MKALGLRSLGVASGGVLARISVLVFLAGLARGFDTETYRVLLFGVGAGLAAQVVLDPSSIGTYLLRETGPGGDRSAWALGLRLAVPIAVVVIVVPVLVVGLSGDIAVSELVTVGGLGVLAAAESVVRYARWVWQAAERFAPYVGVDVCVAAGRLTLAALAWSTGSGTLLVIGCVAVGIALLVAVLPAAYRAGASTPTGSGVSTLSGLARAVAPYAGSMALSAGYSQAPTILSGLRSGVAAGALFTGATRVTQPTELLPASVASSFLPRLLSDPTGRARLFRVQMAVALAMGVAVAGVVVVIAPLASKVLALPKDEIAPILSVLALALPFKFMNYQLVSLAIASGGIGMRLRATAVVAIASVVALWFVAPYGGRSTAVVVVGAEALLFALLLAVSVLISQDKERPS